MDSAKALSGSGTQAGNVASCDFTDQVQLYLRATNVTMSQVTMSRVYLVAGNGIKNATSEEEFEDESGTLVNMSLADDTPPSFSSFVEFDMDYGLLTFSFSETVNVSSLNFTKLSVQSDFDADPTDPKYTLTGGTCDASCNCTSGKTISFCLTTADLNRIKAISGLCSSETDCVPNYEAGFITDLLDPRAPDRSSHMIAAYDSTRVSAHQLVTFTDDTTRPQLVDFDINFSDDTLTLSFNEPVRVSTFDRTEITLQSNATAASPSYTLTTETVVPSTDATVVVLELNGDADQLKLLDFATSSANTYIRFSEDTATDVARTPNKVVAIESTAAKKVKNYTNDTTGPTLDSFTLDFDANTLIITFSEPVLTSSLTLRNFTIHNDDGVSYDLSKTKLTAGTGSKALTVSVELDTQLITNLKTDTSIGVDDTNTFLNVTASSFRDIRNNSNSNQQQVEVTDVVADSSPATLSNFTIDMNSATLVLTFTDVIKISSFRPRRIELQNASEVPAGASITIQGETPTGSNSTIITLPLTDTDINTLKASPFIATNVNDTYITIQAAAFDDLRGVDITAVTVGIRVHEFIVDSEPPLIVTSTLDMNRGQIILTFDEPMDTKQITYSSIEIRENGTERSRSFPLTGGSTASASSDTVLTVTLTTTDLNNLKANVNIGTSSATSYLYLAGGAFQDVAGVDVIASDAGSGSAADQFDEYIPDTTSPSLQNFTLDLDAGTISITFDETVNYSTLVLTNMIIQSDDTASPASFRELTGGTFTAINSPELTITLLNTDFFNLTLLPGLATNVSNTYLTVSAGTVNDMSSQSSTARRRQAGAVIPDQTPPTLVEYAIDFSTDSVELTFNEPVDVSTLNFSAFTLYNEETFSSASKKLTLKGSSTSSNGLTVVVLLDNVVALNLKNTTGLADRRNNAWLGFESNAIRDIAGNGITGRTVTGIEAENIIEDNSGAVLDGFDLDMDNGRLVLSFSETIEGDTFVPSSFTFHNGDDSFPVKLTGGTFVSIDASFDVTIQLSNDDLNSIKAEFRTAVSNATTYLDIAVGGFTDGQGNEIQAINDRQVTTFTPDTTPPKLTAFELQPPPPSESGLILLLIFDEPVRISTVDAADYTLLNSSDSSLTVRFTDATVRTTTNSSSVELKLTNANLDDIRNKFPLGNSTATTFLSVTSGAVLDMVGLGSVEINATVPLQARNITIDLTPPTLDSFTLDMDAGSAFLTFTEPTDTATLNFTQITFQSTGSSSAISYTLASTNTASLTGNVVNVTFSANDLDELKLETSLTSTSSSVFVSASRGFIDDTAGNPNLAIPVTGAVSGTLVPDTMRPRLASFDIDMDSGNITLSFNEPVDISTLASQHIELQRADGNPSSGSREVLDSGYKASEPDGRELSFTLNVCPGNLT